MSTTQRTRYLTTTLTLQIAALAAVQAIIDNQAANLPLVGTATSLNQIAADHGYHGTAHPIAAVIRMLAPKQPRNRFRITADMRPGIAPLRAKLLNQLEDATNGVPTTEGGYQQLSAAPTTLLPT